MSKTARQVVTVELDEFEEWMSGSRTAVTLLMVDRESEMSSCRQRRAEYRATGVPSARGGEEVGPSVAFQSRRSNLPYKLE
jgi:hypothetical protein